MDEDRHLLVLVRRGRYLTRCEGDEVLANDPSDTGHRVGEHSDPIRPGAPSTVDTAGRTAVVRILITGPDAVEPILRAAASDLGDDRDGINSTIIGLVVEHRARMR